MSAPKVAPRPRRRQLTPEDARFVRDVQRRMQADARAVERWLRRQLAASNGGRP
jgi:hypothetical protein